MFFIRVPSETIQPSGILYELFLMMMSVGMQSLSMRGDGTSILLTSEDFASLASVPNFRTKTLDELARCPFPVGDTVYEQLLVSRVDTTAYEMITQAGGVIYGLMLYVEFPTSALDNAIPSSFPGSSMFVDDVETPVTLRDYKWDTSSINEWVDQDTQAVGLSCNGTGPLTSNFADDFLSSIADSRLITRLEYVSRHSAEVDLE